MDTIAIWSMIAAMGSAAAAFTSWMTAHTALKTGRRQHSAALLADLTTGEVATARDTIGSWLYGTDEQHAPISKAELIRAYYTVAWALERLAVGRTALGAMRFGDKKATKELDQSLLWHVEEQARNLHFIAHHVAMDNTEVERSLASIQKEIPYLTVKERRTVRQCGGPGCWRRPGVRGVAVA